MIATIILAAGQSRRMGRLKQMMPWGNDTILGNVIDNFRQGGANPILVVVGHDSSRIKQELADRKVVWVENRDYQTGMGSSIRAGLKALPDNAEAALIALGDLPLVKPDTVSQIIRTFREKKQGIIVPTCQGKTGHPVLFAREYFPQLLAVTGDVGARQVIRNNSETVVYLGVNDPGIHTDIDDPGTYARLRPKKEDYLDAGLD